MADAIDMALVREAVGNRAAYFLENSQYVMEEVPRKTVVE